MKFNDNHFIAGMSAMEGKEDVLKEWKQKFTTTFIVSCRHSFILYPAVADPLLKMTASTIEFSSCVIELILC